MNSTAQPSLHAFSLLRAVCVIAGSLLATCSLQAALAEAWTKRYNSSANHYDSAMAAALDRTGNVAVTGESHNGTNADFYTAKYSALDGALLWERRYNGPTNKWDYARAMAVDSSGHVIVTGSSHGGAYWDTFDFYTAKYGASDGALLWEKRYNGPGGWADEARAVAVDNEGDVIVFGSADGGASGQDFCTVKYAASDGALLWERRRSGPANSEDYAEAIALGSNGEVVVTGWSRWNGVSEFYTAKYAGTNGAVQWETRGPSGIAQAVAVDGQGNVVVTGFSGDDDWDYYTAKYAATDGALLWEQRYNGMSNEGDVALALALDRDGNAVVTGRSSSLSTSVYYTAKYAAGDGTLLWEKRYGQTGLQGGATAVSVDAIGDVIVTGSFSSTNIPATNYTVKYAAADGALLWEKCGGPTSPRSLALGTNGMIVIAGESSVGGTDYMTSVYLQSFAAPRLTALIRSGNDFQCSIAEATWTNCSVLASTNLADWTVIGAATRIAPGQFQFTDPDAGQFAARFYRLRTP